MRKLLFWGVLALVVGMLGYIRLAPVDVARWHVPVAASADADMAGGAIRVIDGTEADLQRLREIALQTPRTQQIAGSVEEGLITFQTRSRWMGFPDYTTVQLVDGQIRMNARLRFGQDDLGVNTARLESWISDLGRG